MGKVLLSENGEFLCFDSIFGIEIDFDFSSYIESNDTASINKMRLKACKDYLTQTDWYYIRKAETGELVSDEVIAKRAEAREFIRNYNA